MPTLEVTTQRGHVPYQARVGVWSDPFREDWNLYPWAGLFRCLIMSYRLNLPHLRDLTLQVIERAALKEVET